MDFHQHLRLNFENILETICSVSYNSSNWNCLPQKHSDHCFEELYQDSSNQTNRQWFSIRHHSGQMFSLVSLQQILTTVLMNIVVDKITYHVNHCRFAFAKISTSNKAMLSVRDHCVTRQSERRCQYSHRRRQILANQIATFLRIDKKLPN